MHDYGSAMLLQIAIDFGDAFNKHENRAMDLHGWSRASNLECEHKWRILAPLLTRHQLSSPAETLTCRLTQSLSLQCSYDEYHG